RPSIATRWGACALRRSASCPENLGSPRDVSGQTLSPVRALLVRISLGLRPWLHRLRSGLLRLVRRPLSYDGGVRLLVPVHHRLRLLTFPMRAAVLNTDRTLTAARHEISQVPTRSFCA